MRRIGSKTRRRDAGAGATARSRAPLSFRPVHDGPGRAVRRADLVLFPNQGIGLGRPVLEGASHGRPAIASGSAYGAGLSSRRRQECCWPPAQRRRSPWRSSASPWIRRSVSEWALRLGARGGQVLRNVLGRGGRGALQPRASRPVACPLACRARAALAQSERACSGPSRTSRRFESSSF